jgi:hypothetical protein
VVKYLVNWTTQTLHRPGCRHPKADERTELVELPPNLDDAIYQLDRDNHGPDCGGDPRGCMIVEPMDCAKNMPYHQVQIFDSTWGGWRWYQGLTEDETYSRVTAGRIAQEAAERSAVHRYRVLNLRTGEPVRVVLPRRRAVGNKG